MSERAKYRLITVGIIIAIVLLWFWLRRIPAVQQAIKQTASDLGLPDPGALLPLDQIDMPDTEGVDAGYYVPHDFPAIGGDTTDRYSPCNFCIQSSMKIATPSPPAKVVPVAVQTPPRTYPRLSSSSVSWAQPQPKSPNWGPTGLPMGMGYIPGIFG